MDAKRAVVIGLTHVDAKKYGGWDGKNGCQGCARDVERVSKLLSERGFEVQVLLDGQATARRVLNALKQEARRAMPGDLLAFYTSCHGGQVADTNGDEDDGSDETLVLFDRQIIDDELNSIWLQLNGGVRVVMVSDACHSETNMKALALGIDRPAATKAMPLRRLMSPRDSQTMQAQMIHLAGCRDAGESQGYLDGGAFTKAMVGLLEGKQFRGNYYDLLKQIAASDEVRPWQDPQYNEYGPVESQFRNQQPFRDEAAPRLRADPAGESSRCIDTGEAKVSITINIGGAGRDGHSRDGHGR